MFEQIECLNYHWKGKIVDYAWLNEEDIEELELEEFEYLEQEEAMFSDNEDEEEDA